MKVLVAFEHSGIVRDAFRARGHAATSCDLLDSDGTGPHITGDARDAIGTLWGAWDLIIMHPPCTALCVSGNAHYGRGRPKHQQRLDSIEWTMDIWERATDVCRRVAMENPVGVLPMKPSQSIQPYQYGHAESKRTCLWLRGLPLLKATKYAELPASGRWLNQTPSGQNKLGPSPDRWKLRSRTYGGIADAMADQWGQPEELL
jgi:hypothetical protein